MGLKLSNLDQVPPEVAKAEAEKVMARLAENRSKAEARAAEVRAQKIKWFAHRAQERVWTTTLQAGARRAEIAERISAASAFIVVTEDSEGNSPHRGDQMPQAPLPITAAGWHVATPSTASALQHGLTLKAGLKVHALSSVFSRRRRNTMGRQDGRREGGASWMLHIDPLKAALRESACSLARKRWRRAYYLVSLHRRPTARAQQQRLPDRMFGAQLEFQRLKARFPTASQVLLQLAEVEESTAEGATHRLVTTGSESSSRESSMFVNLPSNLPLSQHRRKESVVELPQGGATAHHAAQGPAGYNASRLPPLSTIPLALRKVSSGQLLEVGGLEPLPEEGSPPRKVATTAFGPTGSAAEPGAAGAVAPGLVTGSLVPSRAVGNAVQRASTGANAAGGGATGAAPGSPPRRPMSALQRKGGGGAAPLSQAGGVEAEASAECGPWVVETRSAIPGSAALRRAPLAASQLPTLC